MLYLYILRIFGILFEIFVFAVAAISLGVLAFVGLQWWTERSHTPRLRF
jgi:hypothetical protein